MFGIVGGSTGLIEVCTGGVGEVCLGGEIVGFAAGEGLA